MTLPADYAERVYAGVLGKVIGVYLGRPFEGWTYQMIQERLGDVEYYVHDRLGVPLIVTDDDISGTFTFLRALEDHGTHHDLSAKQVGESWLNYLIRERTILWWGGMGNSTEHTAYLRLANGISAPESGSIALNGKVVAEQIGAQIFIDGWAMVCPGDPEQAVRFADAAARVSHDGEAVYGARVLAAMESMAFVESDTDRLIDQALSFIPVDSVIATMIDDIRGWHVKEKDWRATRELIEANYGYDKYGGNCHMVPNHGLIIHSLLHGAGDFSETMKIINTCGWDTDCNSGNVGCLLGIKEGLGGIDAGLNKGLDWRGPIADRIYIPTADGGRAISDCAAETLHIVNMGRKLAGGPALRPKHGAQFHFSLPGSLQGFQVSEGDGELINEVFNEPLTEPGACGDRAIAIHAATDVRVGTPVFTPSKEIARYFDDRGYALLASPRIFPGQLLEGVVGAVGVLQTVSLYLACYGENDEPLIVDSEPVEIPSGERMTLSMVVPDLPGPIYEIGVRTGPGKTLLERIKWSGTPAFTLERPSHKGTMWRRAWVNGVDDLVTWRHLPEMLRLIQNQGTGLVMQGTGEWTDYQVSARITPHLARRTGIAARVQGMTRYYALLLTGTGKIQLIRSLHQEYLLAEAEFDWCLGQTLELKLCVDGDRIQAGVDGEMLFDCRDDALNSGALGFVIDEGRVGVQSLSVGPKIL